MIVFSIVLMILSLYLEYRYFKKTLRKIKKDRFLIMAKKYRPALLNPIGIVGCMTMASQNTIYKYRMKTLSAMVQASKEDYERYMRHVNNEITQYINKEINNNYEQNVDV